MSLLGREWQDREKARVEEYNTRLESLRNKEQQLQKRMEQADNREKELGEIFYYNFNHLCLKG